MSNRLNHHIVNSLKRPKLASISMQLNQAKLRKTNPYKQLPFAPWLIHTITMVILVPTIAINADIMCPKDLAPMYPCTCRNGTIGLLIRCTNSNLATLSNSLRNIEGTIEQVEIENSIVTRAFGPLFNDSKTFSFHSTISELDIRASNLRTVDWNSFSRELLINVKFLMLDRNQLQRVPSELFDDNNKMTNLKLLNLSTNVISSLEPNSFVKLVNLTELDLSNNRISKLSKTSFNSLNSLEHLDLSGNELTKLDKNIFAFGRKLRHLDLSNNRLANLDRQDLNELTALETLKLAKNQLTSLPRSLFARNAKLYNLDLSANKLEDIDTYLLKSTRFLKELDVSGNQIREITKNTFSPTTRIKRINLAKNNLQALTAETFKGLEFLEKIDLSYNQIVNISNDAFSKIYQLEIDLSHNKLARIFYWAFHEVGNMTKLDLSHNQLDDGVSLIAFESTDCAHLDLSYNQIQDISKIPIGNLTGIRILNISHNQIIEFNKKSLTQKLPLYELHTIDASHNNISQITGNLLERLKSIRTIDLSYNSLRRLTSGAFGNSPTLIDLDLRYNNLVEIVSGTLIGLISLKSLDLSHNRLKKMIPVPVALNTIHLEHNEIGQLSKAAFPSLNSLLELYLDHNRVTHLDEGTFSTLAALHTLELSNNNISSVPFVALKELTSLQTLRLDGNNIQRLNRKAFGTLPIVFHLRLDRNNISSVSDHAFDGMLQLLSLNLSHNHIIELPPETFAGLVSLRSLDVSNNQINRFENKTRSAMEDLLSLEEVNFSNNKLSLITQKTFLNSPYIPYRLTRLDLSNNLIGILVNHFAYGLKKVEWLNLRNNIINEIFPNVIGNMTKLKHLDLSFNKLRTLKEGTFSGQLTNLSTILLNNNKLTTIRGKEFDKLPSLTHLDLSTNRLETIIPETDSWVRRGMALNLKDNNLECSCNQLPLVAWIDNFKARLNSAYTILFEAQHQQQLQQHYRSNGNRHQLTPATLPQYIQSTELITSINCTKPGLISGRPIMQMLDGISSVSPTNGQVFSCDHELLSEVDKLRRLRAPVQFLGAEPYLVGSHQHVQIGWTLVDPHVDILNFVLMRAKFEQPIDLSPQGVKILRSSSTENVKFLAMEHEIEYIPYSERTWILHNLDPTKHYVICLTYETNELQTVSGSLEQGVSLIKQLKTSNSSIASNKSILASILTDYDQTNCANLNSLLQRDTPDRLIASSSGPNVLIAMHLIIPIIQVSILYILNNIWPSFIMIH